MTIVFGLAAIIAAYLLGAIPFGLIVTKFTTGEDVRESGSGNIGATNVLRTAGMKAGIATLVLDILKGIIAVLIADLATRDAGGSSYTFMALAALAVTVGHVFPVFLGFQGGKGVATFAGAFWYMMPMVMIGATLIFLATVYLTHYISAASIVSAASFPIGAWVIEHPGYIAMLCIIAASALIVWRHESNMVRIRLGTENVFRWTKEAEHKMLGRVRYH